MASDKKKAVGLRPEAASPTDLMKELKEAGYALVRRFTRKGNALTVYLKPAGLKDEAGNFRALETCTALGLQADCRVHAAVPQDLLILSVDMTEDGDQKTEAGRPPEKPSAKAATTNQAPTPKH